MYCFNDCPIWTSPPTVHSAKGFASASIFRESEGEESVNAILLFRFPRAFIGKLLPSLLGHKREPVDIIVSRFSRDPPTVIPFYPQLSGTYTDHHTTAGQAKPGPFIVVRSLALPLITLTGITNSTDRDYFLVFRPRLLTYIAKTHYQPNRPKHNPYHGSNI